MDLSMFFHEFLAILVVCTLGGWAPLFERSWVQFPVSRVGKDGVYIRVTYIYAYCIARIQYASCS